mgnify:CR=1 FL=1
MIKSEQTAETQLFRQLQRAARQVRDMIGLRAFRQAIAGTPPPPIRIAPDPPRGALVPRSIFFKPQSHMIAMHNGEKIGIFAARIWG